MNLKDIKKFIKKNEKDTLKVLKRTFGMKSITQAINEESKLSEYLENKFKKQIDFITWEDVKENYNLINGYSYAKYLTLRTIIDQYLENKKLYPYSNHLEEIINDY